MRKFQRVILLILDSVGCGAQEDAGDYQSLGANTLKSIFNNQPEIRLPHLEALGLRTLLGEPHQRGIVGKMRQLSAGNDTFAGVWEMMGVAFSERFRTAQDPLPCGVLRLFTAQTGHSLVGNEYLSGFQALDKFFLQHQKSRAPILYLADDGVVLLAAHEEVIPPGELNRLAGVLAKVLASEQVARVITRPFVGDQGRFIRTEHRKDFLVMDDLFSRSALAGIKEEGVSIWTTEHLHRLLGQPEVSDILPGNHTNLQLSEHLIKKLMSETGPAFFFLCFQDFDMFGHRKDVLGYGNCLMEFDERLFQIQKAMRDDDLLLLSADHGCDPTLPIRGHTREFVPLLVYSPALQSSCFLGEQDGFHTIGQTIRYNFSLSLLKAGKPLYEIF